MARLIDADKLIVKLHQDQPMDWTGSDAEVQELNDWKLFRNMVDNAPTVDAVPVVRCKDCKHHYWEQEPCHGKSVHYCELPHMRGIEVFKEFFCYYGERKDGDGNG